MSVHRRTTQAGTRYDVRLRAPDGRQFTRSFRTRRDADAFGRDQLSTLQRGTWIDPSGGAMLFGDWVDEWMEQRVGLRPKTLHTDTGIIERYLRPALGAQPLSLITPREVQRLIATWSRRLAPNTVRRNYAVVRAVFNAAVEADLIARTPCRSVKLPRPEPTAHRILDPVELRRLAEAVPIDYRAMVYLAGVLGLRFGECAGLRVGRLDFFRKTLTVAESLGEVGGELVVGNPKSRASRRTVAVPEPLMELLAAHLARGRLTAADRDTFVFSAPQGGPVRYAAFRSRVWLPAVSEANVKGVTFHSLRHLAATAMVVEGVDIRTAQHRLGHSDPRLLLNIYAHVSSDADRDAARRLGERFLADDRDEALQSDAQR